MSRDEIAALRECGTLHRWHAGVYAVGTQDLPAAGKAMAALLAVGPGAALGEIWASWAHGTAPEPAGDVVVIAARRSGARSKPGYVVRRPERTETVVRNDLRVTTIERTLLDLAATDITDAELVRIAGEAFRLKKLTQRTLKRALDDHPRHRGRRRLARLADDRLMPTRSAAEDTLFAAMRAAGLTDFEVNRRSTGRERDAYFPAASLNIEVDGVEFHSLRHVIEDDHERDMQGRARGILTLRYTPRQIRDALADVLAEIRRERAARTPR